MLCRHCWLAPRFDEDGKTYPVIDVELFTDVIRQAKPLGLYKVKLTGGEPLLHPHIQEILDVVKNENLQISIETNATLCTPTIARQIASFKTPFVSVSLDGANAQTHEYIRGVPGCFEKAKRGILNLIKAGVSPQIILTIMQHNVDQIEAVIRLAESLGAKSVKYNLVQPASRGEMLHREGQTVPVAKLIEIGRYVEETLSKTTKLPLYFTYPHAFRPLGRMFDENERECASCGILNVLGVLPGGSFALCGIGEIIPELTFGNAKTDMLKNVWEKNPVLNLLRKGLPSNLKGICSNCVMSHICRGACIAQNYYSTRDLWAPFWFCDEAERMGLFPGSRKIHV